MAQITTTTTTTTRAPLPKKDTRLKGYVRYTGDGRIVPGGNVLARSKPKLGKWEQMGNPCIGPDAKSTFNSQSTFVLALPGEQDRFLFMADRWNKTNLPDSRYIWLPIKMKENKPLIKWIP